MACALWAAMGAAASAPTTDAPVVLPADAKVDGRGYAQLITAWWQWVHALPLAPYLDADGSLCGLGQQGPVWFLAGTDGSFDARRECQVPADRHLFLPIVNMLESTSWVPGSSDAGIPCERLKRDVSMRDEQLSFAVVVIDGVEVKDFHRHHVASDGCFALYPDLPEHERSVPIAYSDGYWLMIAPLTPGRHTLTIDAQYDGFGGANQRMVQRVQYVLWVGKERPRGDYVKVTAEYGPAGPADGRNALGSQEARVALEDSLVR